MSLIYCLPISCSSNSSQYLYCSILMLSSTAWKYPFISIIVPTGCNSLTLLSHVCLFVLTSIYIGKETQLPWTKLLHRYPRSQLTCNYSTVHVQPSIVLHIYTAQNIHKRLIDWVITSCSFALRYCKYVSIKNYFTLMKVHSFIIISTFRV